MLETVKVKFRGEREIILNYAIFVIIGTKMLRKGCEAYLAYLIDIEKEGTMLSKIPVVKEFPNVFPEYSQGEKWKLL